MVDFTSRDYLELMDLQDELWKSVFIGIYEYDGNIKYPWIGYCNWMIQELGRLSTEVNANILSIDVEDIKQAFIEIWLGAYEDFVENKPCASIRNYMIRRSVWGMRDWYIKEMNILMKLPYNYYLEEDPPFLLNLNFLLYGTEIEPLNLLSPYQRYLIFLQYKEEKTIFEIADIVQRDEKTIRYQINSILNLLRSAK